MSESADTPLVRLLRQLDLEPRGRSGFQAEPIPGSGRLFGGLVAAQSVVAAGRTVAEGALHSLHAYFLRPGAHEVPIRFEVDRIRDGRTFTTRRVIAVQDGEAIFNLSASFARPEEGIAHQESPMPEAPDPEGLPDWEVLRAQALGEPAARRDAGAIAIRACDPRDVDPRRRLPARKLIWLRPVGSLPEDPLVHAAVLVYASDRTLLSTAARPHGLSWGKRRAASLDHAMWLHHVPYFDDWLLYASESPVAHAARGLILGGMYRRDGVRIASVAQEGLIRIARDR
ncbi:MAG: acyl-CoA thioesterase II [Deltaproteobacteria bacterium]|nr:MAG: acyl-CoA thioesterase II [Deltaproteobacteria bacterium]